MVTIDLIDSFNCEIQAETEEEALKKAEDITTPQEYNVPHFSRTEVIGVDGEAYYLDEDDYPDQVDPADEDHIYFNADPGEKLK